MSKYDSILAKVLEYVEKKKLPLWLNITRKKPDRNNDFKT